MNDRTTTGLLRPGWHARPRASVALAATAGLAVTVLAGGTSLIDFAYASVPLHVAVETTAAMASLITAQIAYGRFRSSLRLSDLLLLAALFSFAVTNLLFAALPALVEARPGPFRTWAPVGGVLISSSLLALAAFARDRPVHQPRLAARRALLGTSLALAVIALLVLLLGDALPVAVAPSISPADLRSPQIVGDPVVLTTQLLSTLLFAATAAGFAARAERTGDALTRWLAVGATLGAFARLNYFLFPSLYTEWFYTGDVLRLGCFVAIFIGAMQETRRLQEALAAAAVLEERQRMARDLHDGVAQDLAFVVQQMRRVNGSGVRPDVVERIVGAAERALDESRQAIAALARKPDRPLPELLSATAREAGEREGSVVEVRVSDGLELPLHAQEELLRVAREAVLNAARHGGARRIRVELTDQPHLRLVVSDDGRGFDPDAAHAAPGRLGLATMRHRVESIGGELTISSQPGGGTEVRVSIP